MQARRQDLNQKQTCEKTMNFLDTVIQLRQDDLAERKWLHFETKPVFESKKDRESVKKDVIRQAILKKFERLYLKNQGIDIDDEYTKQVLAEFERMNNCKVVLPETKVK